MSTPPTERSTSRNVDLGTGGVTNSTTVKVVLEIADCVAEVLTLVLLLSHFATVGGAK